MSASDNAPNRPLREAMDAILDLHKPWYEIAGTRYTNRVTVNEDDMTPEIRLRHQCVTESQAGGWDEPCVPGEDHQVEACAECRTSTPDYEIAFYVYPCATAKILLDLRGTDG